MSYSSQASQSQDPVSRILKTHSMVVIRQFRKEDTQKVVEAVKAAFDSYGFNWYEDGYCADLYDIATHYPAPDHGFWVIEHDGEVCGCVGVSYFEPIDQKTALETHRIAGADCELHRLYIHPDKRGNGFGKLLLDQVAQAAKTQGCQLMEIWSDKKLEHAHTLYMRAGAKMMSERICPGDPDESPEYGLGLPLGNYS